MLALLITLAAAADFHPTPREAVMDVLPAADRGSLPVYVSGLPRPGGSVRYWARVLSRVPRGEMVRVQVGAEVGARAWPPVVLELATRPTATAVVAKRAMAAGTIIRSEDVELRSGSWPQASTLAPRLAGVVGTKLERSVAAGDPVRVSAVVRPNILRRGTTVRILLRHGGFSIEIEGVALEDGARDELVRVRNPSTNKVITARVHGPTEVHVPQD